MNSYIEAHSFRFHLGSLGGLALGIGMFLAMLWISSVSTHDEAIWYGLVALVCSVVFCFRGEDLSAEPTTLRMSDIDLVEKRMEVRTARPGWGERIRLSEERDRRRHPRR